MHTELNFREAEVITETLATYSRLLLVDGLWTAATEDVLNAETSDIVRIGRELKDQVDRAHVQTGELLELFVTRGSSLRQDVVEGMRALPAPQQTELANLIVEGGDSFTDASRTIFGGLRDQTEQVLAELDSRIAGVDAGGPVFGDLPKPFLCSVAQCMMLGGVVAIALPPHIYGGAVVAAAIKVYRELGCKH